MDATRYRQQIAVLGDEGGNQILERGAFPVAHDRNDEADQRSQQFKRLPALPLDGGQSLSDIVIGCFRLARVLCCHSRLHALVGRVDRRCANGYARAGLA